MAAKQMQIKLAAMRDALFSEGLLDEQFVQLEELDVDASSTFVEDVANIFFSDAVTNVNNIQQEIEKQPMDFAKLDRMVHSLKGSSSSLGAAKVKDACILLRQHAQDKNADGVIAVFQQVKENVNIIKTKLEVYFQMLNQLRTGETIDPAV